jgi:hypothetical protein
MFEFVPFAVSKSKPVDFMKMLFDRGELREKCLGEGNHIIMNEKEKKALELLKQRYYNS